MNEHKNIITIEDEIKEFSDKPVKSSALFKKFKDAGVPDSSEASAGDVLSLDEDKKPTWAAPGGGMPDDLMIVEITWDSELENYVVNKTIDEILDHNGKPFICIDVANGCIAMSYVVWGNKFEASFAQLQKDGNDYLYSVYTYTINSDNSITYVYNGKITLTNS